ncbi:MAG: phosphate acyltransferase PlsX [Anaerolineae bacterium]
MKIVVDAMGSDRHPQPDVEGAVQAAREYGVEIVLVGRQEVVEPELAKYNLPGINISLVHASQIIEMKEHPAAAVKSKKDASMVVAMQMLKRGEVDAFVSAGNSGGILASALFYLGRIKGVKRPALSSVFPTRKGPCFMLDLGANTDCKPEYLLQFAIMGSVYAERVLGIANPRVAIVSNGEEEGKGNVLVQETYPLLKASGLNFVGNAEGKDIPAGFADVIVTDGFTGNVIVKLTEGVAGFLLEIIKEEIKNRPLAVVGALLAKGAFDQVRRRLDYREYGGGPLLGVDGIVIVAHGRSDSLAMKNAIRVAKQAVEQGTLNAIRDGIAQSLSKFAEA